MQTITINFHINKFLKYTFKFNNEEDIDKILNENKNCKKTYYYPDTTDQQIIEINYDKDYIISKTTGGIF